MIQIYSEKTLLRTCARIYVRTEFIELSVLSVYLYLEYLCYVNQHYWQPSEARRTGLKGAMNRLKGAMN